MESGESIHEDHCCSICLGVFFKPVRLNSCRHTFCLNCLTEAAIITRHLRCPLCRTPFPPNHFHPHHELQTTLTALYPQALLQKEKIIRQRVMVRLLIGNSTEVLQTNEDNKYRWTVYVRPVPGQPPLSETISSIQFELHPTFNPRLVSIPITGNKTAALTRVGWGTFRIGVKINWKGGVYEEKTSEMHHDLEFDPVSERTAETFLTILPKA